MSTKVCSMPSLDAWTPAILDDTPQPLKVIAMAQVDPGVDPVVDPAGWCALVKTFFLVIRYDGSTYWTSSKNLRFGKVPADEKARP
jgi:hypothetical protein